MGTEAAIVDRRRDWLRQMAMLVVVMAMHVGLWMTLGEASPRFWQKPATEIDPQSNVLQVRFNHTVPRTLRTPHPAAMANARPADLPHQEKKVMRVLTADHPPTVRSPAPVIALTGGPAVSPTAGTGHVADGGFQEALQNAQRASSGHLPGSLVPRVSGIALENRTSIKDTVTGVAKALRCSNMEFSMQRAKNPLTPQLMDRLLQLESCGPNIKATPNDAVENTVVHDATFSH